MAFQHVWDATKLWWYNTGRIIWTPWARVIGMAYTAGEYEQIVHNWTLFHDMMKNQSMVVCFND